MTVDRERLSALKIDREPENERSGRRWLYIVVGIVIAALVATALLFARAGSAPEVEVATATSGGASDGPATVLNASGYVTARRQATVSSKVTGRVVEVLVEEGMPVTQGQVLARLDPSTASSELRLAESQVTSMQSAMEETRVRIAEARVDLRRAESLTEQKIGTQAEADRAKAQLDALRARLDAQAAELEVTRRRAALSRQNASENVIVAPFDGVVISKNAQAGEMISPMSSGGFTRTGICTIVDMNSLEIEVDVSEAYINRVHPSQKVIATLDAYPDWQIPAHVIAVVPAADRQKATVRVRIAIDEKDPRILPDMGARVAFVEGSDQPLRRAEVVIVPRAAVVRDGETDIVFVVRDGTAERRAVRVASTDDDAARIEAGVTAGEQVALNPGDDVSDGARVRIREKSQ